MYLSTVEPYCDPFWLCYGFLILQLSLFEVCVYIYIYKRERGQEENTISGNFLFPPFLNCHNLVISRPQLLSWIRKLTETVDRTITHITSIFKTVNHNIFFHKIILIDLLNKKQGLGFMTYFSVTVTNSVLLVIFKNIA